MRRCWEDMEMKVGKGGKIAAADSSRGLADMGGSADVVHG